MIVGIVGSESSKFTEEGERRAKLAISNILNDWMVTEVVSGGCHLGGIDIWAVEMAKDFGIPVTEFKPEKLEWTYYKKRNLQIADRSDVVFCITVDRLPENFTGMRFKSCYHCRTSDHVKSGGCWTMKQAIKMGKPGHLVVIKNENS